MQSLIQKQQLPISIEEAWAFLSNPRNLEEITPPSLKFRIVEVDSEDTYVGQIITYRIRLFPMIWTPWITEIKNVEPGRQFTDEQRVGPYAFWHHTHLLEPNAKGVLMTDHIRYHVGMGPIGAVAEALYVNRAVREIFRFRRGILEKKFGAEKAGGEELVAEKRQKCGDLA